MSPISYFSTHIHVFNRLSEALLQIETARDGIYLCYINNDGTADGYFGFLSRIPAALLSCCDEVTGIGTPFEYRQSQWNPRLQDIKDEDGRKVHTEMHFSFWIGFSKRTLNRILKENR